MPQGPLAAAVATRNGALAPMQMDKGGSLLTGRGAAVSYNITAATVVKATPGRVCSVSVLVAGSAAGTVNNLATTSGAAVANQIAVIPNTVGVLTVDMPASVGILVTPGTGQTVAVSYA